MIDVLPSETIEYILTLCTPRDVASFAQTCSSAHRLIYQSSDNHLWRQLFLAVPFDDLRLSPDFTPESTLDWKSELINRVGAELTLISHSTSEDAIEGALDIVLHTVRQAPVGGPKLSANIAWANHLLEPHVITTLTQGPSSQTLAQLLAYMGLTQLDPSEPAQDLRIRSKAHVYDLRQYTLESTFGIFRIKGTRVYGPNWVHLQYCVNVVVTSVPDSVLGYILPPRGLEATRAHSAPVTSSHSPRDWAGVEGVWRRYVCFMGYGDLQSQSTRT